MPRTSDKAKWIWIAWECHTEDFYLRARRTFRLADKPAEARLRVTAFSEYVLYVNGQYIGCGPTPSSPQAPQVDVYTLDDLRLARGPNVIAVLAHNYHVGLPRLPRMSGGLWLQLVVTGADGKTERIGTDGRWRVAPAEDFSRRAPRLYWTAGFAEVRDTRCEPVGWTSLRFSEKRWATADEVRPAPAEGAPPSRPVERAVARPVETFEVPQGVAGGGRVAWPAGVTAVPFEFTVPNRAHGEFYAASFVHTRTRQKARLAFDCDEAAAIYVNNHQVIRQGYSEDFVYWLSDQEHDDYTGIHRGQGNRVESAEVWLDPGWNSVGVVIYDPGSSWGFAMRFVDPKTGEPLPLVFSPNMKSGEMTDWHIVRDQLCPCGDGSLPDTPSPNERTFPDPAYQLAWEKQVPRREAARGAASLLAEPRGKGPLVLPDGAYVVYDFGGEVVGRVELQVEGPAGTILDLAWSEDIGPGGAVEPVRRGMRQVDRLILRGDRQTVRFFNRRTLRYLQLVARTGGGGLKVHRLGIHATRAEPPALPETDDKDLAAAMALAGRTVRCCIQRTLEGSPAREAEQSLPAAYLLAQAERTFYGRTALGEAALCAFADDQHEDGFFRSIVPSGTIHTVPDWNLLWILWLAEHVAWTGDKALARKLCPAAEKCLDWTAQFHDTYGLLENRSDRRPWWLFVDLAPVDKRGEVTAWQALYVRALRAAAYVADFAGNEESAEHSLTEADTVARRARERLWDAARGLFVDARLFEHMSAGATPATNYYALYGGLASEEQAERILASLWNDGRESADWGPRENPYVKYFALEALLERGLADRALAMIRSYWGAMAREGLTTVPEVFPLPDDRHGDGRDGRAEGPYLTLPPPVLCHGWGVHPAALVAKWILGVQPGGPGFEPLVLVPMPDELTAISGRAWTPKGPVEVSIGRDGRGRQIRITVPEKISYRLDRRHLTEDDTVEVTGGRALAAKAVPVAARGK
jgi:hypothetical protein